jgi:hypothetical protein
MSEFKPDWWEDPAFWIEAVARSGGQVGQPCEVKTLFGTYEVTVDHDLSQSPRDEARRMPFEASEYLLRVSSSCALCGSPVQAGHARCPHCGGSEWKGTRVRAVLRPAQVPQGPTGGIKIVVDEGAGEPEGTGCLEALLYLGMMALACWVVLYAIKNY